MWDEVPEAKEFCEQVIKNADDNKLFPQEKFHMFSMGIAATTEVDLHGDCFAPEALYSMATQINSRIIWQLAEHNPLIQPIGRLIAAKVFFAPKTNKHFLAIVCAYYNIQLLPSFKDFGISMTNVDSEENTELEVDLTSPQVKIGFSPNEIKESMIRDMLSQRPFFVDEQPDYQLRKSADPQVIIEVAVNLWLIAFNPFSKKFLERVGEKAADGIISFFNWLIKQVVSRISKIDNEKVLFKIETVYKECRVEFLVDTKDQTILNKAIESLNVAANQAIYVINKLEPYGVQMVIFEYRVSQQQWLLLHATAESIGVISDYPINVDLEKYQGFSPSGSGRYS